MRVHRFAVLFAATAACTLAATNIASADPVTTGDMWALAEDPGECGVARTTMTVGLAEGFPGGESYVLLSPEFYVPAELVGQPHELTRCSLPVTVHWENLDEGTSGSDVVYPMDSRPDRYQTSGNATYIPTGLGTVSFRMSTPTAHWAPPAIEAEIT